MLSRIIKIHYKNTKYYDLIMEDTLHNVNSKYYIWHIPHKILLIIVDD